MNPMPLIVGAPRSGTTLLRMMLDSHPLLAIPPETDFLKWLAHLPAEERTAESFLATVTESAAWQEQGIDPALLRREVVALEPFDLAAATRAAYRLYAERHGKPRWGDKTPLYLFEMDAIEALLPEARFIHLIRDGRDVALSQLPMWFTRARDPQALAQEWVRWVTAGRALGRERRHYLECRYEALVDQPADELARICRFVELEFDPAMLAYHRRAPGRLAELRDRHGSDGALLVARERRVAALRRTAAPPDESRAGRWRTDMDPGARREFELVAGPLLQDLGYPMP